MDILTDIDSKWKDNYDTSESMFTELAGLIIEQENQDDGRSSWYDNVVKFLKIKEDKMNIGEQVKGEVELLQEFWCDCEDGSDNDYYVPDGEGVIEKHHWLCGVCHKIVQIG